MTKVASVYSLIPLKIPATVKPTPIKTRLNPTIGMTSETMVIRSSWLVKNIAICVLNKLNRIRHITFIMMEYNVERTPYYIAF